MLEYYPTLIEEAIEFKVHSRKMISKYKKKKYRPHKSHSICEISSKYRLEEFNNFVYCLEQGQTVQERIAQKELQLRKPNFD